ncbi:FAD:protein FMN transferase [Arcticibacterium luteifluviistationis]|uniref:FAD:protein FMN transferase n=1 Tax=Arcticibacterium luteifluviistationis TaxID=1784714 RepID=UPI0013A70C5B|nr:FAD:protein FMN transferase [Arcticibacterium luteifluviistationis]
MSCKEGNKPYSVLQGYAQGSTFRIVYDPVSSDDYTAEVDSILLVIDKSMSLWDSTSIIRKVNESDEPVIVDEHFKNVFNRSVYFYEISGGAFDPTLSPLIDAWGFARKHGTGLPSDRDIDSLKNYVGLNKFRLEGNKLYKDFAGAQLNFNAIAQGYTADVLGDYLEEQGVPNYLVEIGGETKAKGLNQSGSKWKVGIEKPDFNQTSTTNAVKTVVGLTDGALVTSGSYRKYIEKDGKKYSHTLDAKTGKPVTHNLLSAAVVVPEAMDSDAYATMFMVMGKDAALKYANEHNLAIQCIFDDNGILGVAYSEAFKKLIILEN